ncbi:MAG: sulfite exporter TauE/SafE family protein [Myxococcota bacterium]
MAWDEGFVALAAITLLASVVTGALGYGFSSLTVPVALLFHSGRVLNPALVLVEVVLNLYALLINRAALARVWPRVRALVVGLVPGVALGGYLLFAVQPAWMKLFTYVVLLPLLMLQAAGVRRPVKSEAAAGLAVGTGVGVLYSVTTISGPPLALLFNNQGLVKEDFRAGLAVVRTAESVLTALAYLWLGLFTAHTFSFLGAVVPSVLVGLPLGALLIARVQPEVFRRVCMSFDIWVVAFGLSRVMPELKLIDAGYSWHVFLLPVVIDLVILVHFFLARRKAAGENASATALAVRT